MWSAKLLLARGEGSFLASRVLPVVNNRKNGSIVLRQSVGNVPCAFFMIALVAAVSFLHSVLAVANIITGLVSGGVRHISILRGCIINGKQD